VTETEETFVPLVRPNSPALDAILGKKIPVLDDIGFIRVIDYLGNDTAIVQAARVSYGEGTKTPSDDESLIRYLVRHRHTTPLEMCVLKLHVKLPIFVARQWIRHRTACLAGDVQVTFDLPGRATNGRSKRYYLTVEDIYQRFQPTQNINRPDKQGNPFHRKERVEGMKLRSYNENTMTCYHTNIVDIWKTGVKPVKKVTFGNGGVLRATVDHLCLTDQGWLKLGDALEAGAKFASAARTEGYVSEASVFSEEELASEVWAEWPKNDVYEVSTLGRIRSWTTGGYRQVKRSDSPTIKIPTVNPAGYEVVSLSFLGKSRTIPVSKLVTETYMPGKGPKDQIRHLDNNRRNNRLSNLAFGTCKVNATDRMESGNPQTLGLYFTPVVSACDDGEEMTYDIEVAGPSHNFMAGGVYVHNSVNEYSARYSIMKDEFYVPAVSEICVQSSDNKQGRGEALGSGAPICHGAMLDCSEEAFALYDDLLRYDMSREQARIILPLNTYTEWYWKVDLHNLFHFLALRADSHAQYEIRCYAEAILDIVADWVPMAHRAFKDYVQTAETFSGPALGLLKDALHAAGIEFASQETSGLGKREYGEFMKALGYSE
jgi:flavin-dependent thymidylate synthase